MEFIDFKSRFNYFNYKNPKDNGELSDYPFLPHPTHLSNLVSINQTGPHESCNKLCTDDTI